MRFCTLACGVCIASEEADKRGVRNAPLNEMAEEARRIAKDAIGSTECVDRGVSKGDLD